MTPLTIKTDKQNGIADLLFEPDPRDRDLLEDLHENVVQSVDGASTKGSIRDAIVAVRKRDFQDVVERLAGVYRAPDFNVTIV